MTEPVVVMVRTSPLASAGVAVRPLSASEPAPSACVPSVTATPIFTPARVHARSVSVAIADGSVGDTFTVGESLAFTGIPNFAPELFRRARLRDPLRMKQLQKGLAQLSEEGATQFFRPLMSNDLILGAVGMLQFDVVAYRLKDEYGVDCAFENVTVATARWVHCADAKKLAEFRDKAAQNLALDAAGELVYLAPTRVNLQLTQERWPDVRFAATREHAHAKVEQ